MKPIIIPVLLLPIAISSYSQTWQKCDLGNGYSIDFPATPIVQNIEETETIYGVRYNDCSFSVIVTKLDPKYQPTMKEDEIEDLKALVGLEEAKVEHTLISEKMFRLKNHEWIEVVKHVKSPYGNKKGVMYMSGFISDDMLYQITCLDISENNSSTSETIALFLESIKK